MSKILFSLKSINKILKQNEPSKICIVTSKNLAKKLAWAIKKIDVKKSDIIFLPDGERAKDWQELEKLLKKFSGLNLDRNSVVIALGGGTIGDITGFASSIYLRGIRYIQVPTTLLAQVDSGHGGKTGINFLGYKNQVGSFYLPIATIIDTKFIASLPKAQVINGLGEIIKAGLIKDPSILSLLKKHHLDTLTKSPNLLKIIGKSIAVKKYFVGQDFKDTKNRQRLNFGHTFGHALELKYNISHGQAIIMGMLQELSCTEALKLTPLSVRKSLLTLLKNLGLKIDTTMKPDWKTMLHDKKITGNKIMFPVIESLGKAKLISLDLKVLQRLMRQNLP